LKKASAIILLIVFISIGAIGGFYIYLQIQGQQNLPPEPNAPNAPTILNEDQTIGNHSIILRWTNVLNADNYSIYYNGYFMNSSIDAQEIVYFTGNGTYYITVTALNATGESDHSNGITVIVAIASASIKYVRIYVNSTIYGSLSTEINQYKQDIENQGYSATIINWSTGNASVLKSDLVNSYNQNFRGAVLIGDLPYYLYQNGSIFPSDILLMDLDGLYGDLNNDGVIDTHQSIPGVGDVFPEIWIGRINPECLNNLGYPHIQAYKDYFKKNHDYRTSNLTRPHRGLLYVDDDWSPWNNSWYNAMANSYSNITHIGRDPITTDTDYEMRLTNSSYEFVHAMIHSFPYQHQFGPTGDGSEGITTNSEINSIVTQPLFYNLFCCSACDYTYTNNMGTQYLFSNNTLTVIGSTKTGGMWMPSYFYTPLGQGKTIGESFRLWWWNGLHGPLDSDSQGMCILGDPLLTI